MNWGQIEADWNDHKGDFQRQWGRIPETRFAGTLGRRDDLAE